MLNTLKSLVESLGKMSVAQDELNKCREEQHSLEEDIALGDGEEEGHQLKLANIEQKQNILAETVSAFGV